MNNFYRKLTFLMNIIFFNRQGKQLTAVVKKSFYSSKSPVPTWFVQP